MEFLAARPFDAFPNRRRGGWARWRPRRVGLFPWLLIVGVCGTQLAWAAAEISAHHEPRQPHSGDAVRIIVEPAPDAVRGNWVVEYQINAPGKYRARKDPQFEQDWLALPCVRTEAGKVGATLPGDAQKNRSLVRYRIRAGRAGAVVLPPASDTQGN